jgi:RNA polymerase sigma factor (sigma-70 family)
MNALSPIRSAEDAAFDAAMVAALPKVRRFAQSLVRNPDRASDLVQDTVVLALRGRHNFQAGTNMVAWLGTILRNHVRTENRRAWRWVPMAEGQAEAEPCFADPMVRVELAETLRAIDTLPAAYRQVLRMSMLGFHNTEIAIATNAPDGTVKSRQFRARATLAEVLQSPEPRRPTRKAKPRTRRRYRRKVAP